MPIFIGLIVIFFIILYKRSTGIVVINPLRGQRRTPSPGDEASDSVPDFARLLNTIQQAAPNADGWTTPSTQDHAALLAMVRSHRFIEAMQLYRRMYGVDLQTAKKAIDKMMLEQSISQSKNEPVGRPALKDRRAAHQPMP